MRNSASNAPALSSDRTMLRGRGAAAATARCPLSANAWDRPQVPLGASDIPLRRDVAELLLHLGGLVNNIPADVLVTMGCNFVIAVSVTGPIPTAMRHAGN